MEYVVAFAVTAVGGFLMFELYAWLSSICVWLTRKAAKRMPNGESARFEEEWQAYLHEMPNSLVKLFAVLGFWVAVIKLRAPLAATTWLGRVVVVRLLRLQYLTLKSDMRTSVPVLESTRAG